MLSTYCHFSSIHRSKHTSSVYASTLLHGACIWRSDNVQLSMFYSSSQISSPRATIAHLRVNMYSHWTKRFFFFFFFFFFLRIYLIFF